MIPAVINDQQAMECLGVCLAPIMNGKLDTAVQAHAACLLLDYSTACLLAPGDAPKSPSVTMENFKAGLVAAHAQREYHAIDWPTLAMVLGQLLTSLGPVLSSILAQPPK